MRPSPPNAPMFVSFPAGQEAAPYLLFLKKNADGSCEPVTGQIDPVNSCYILSVAGPEWTKHVIKAPSANVHADTAHEKWLTQALNQISQDQAGSYAQKP